MTIKAIAYSYWRRIKANSRTFESVPDNVKADVRVLAQNDVQNWTITRDDYKNFIGEDYQ